MPLILLHLPEPKTIPDGRPGECPYCGSQILQRWGRVTKPITGRADVTAVIYRYKCQDCEKTFRDYPKGVDRSGITRSIRHLAVILSALGLSSRKIQEVFDRFGINLSHMTIWREGQELAKDLEGHKISTLAGNMILDQEFVQKKSHKYDVLVAINLSEGQYMMLGALNDRDPISVMSWFRPLLKDAGIKAFQIETSQMDRLKYQVSYT
jgi:DNA-directed RNA polymerase subunit RPC12/RpoP